MSNTSLKMFSRIKLYLKNVFETKYKSYEYLCKYKCYYKKWHMSEWESIEFDSVPSTSLVYQHTFSAEWVESTKLIARKYDTMEECNEVIKKHKESK